MEVCEKDIQTMLLNNINYHKVLRLIRMTATNLDQTSTLSCARCVCFTLALGILPSMILPRYVRFLTVPSHRYAFMLDKLNTELRECLVKIWYSDWLCDSASGALESLDHLLLFCSQWLVSMSLWISLIFLKHCFPMKPRVIAQLVF